MPNNEMLKLVQKNAWGLRFYRMGQAKTQSQVADAAEISLRNYQRIESGEVVPKMTTLFQILQALNVSVTDFFSSFPEDGLDCPGAPISSYKFSDLLMLYNTLINENMIHGKAQLEKLQKYIAKGQFDVEHENSVFTADLEGIQTNDISKRIFSQEKLEYHYNEFSEMTMAHAVFSNILHNKEEGEIVTYTYPVNFHGTSNIARVYSCLVKKNWDNPLMLGISEINHGEDQLLGVIHKAMQEGNAQKSII